MLLENREVVGVVIDASFSGGVLIRLFRSVDVGELLEIREGDKTYILKVVDIGLSSLHPRGEIERIVAIGGDVGFEREKRFYQVARAKILLVRENGEFLTPRSVPSHFSPVYMLSPESVKDIFGDPHRGVFIGYLRAGSRVIKDISVYLPGEEMVRHHILVSAATGKGKSNFCKVLLASIILKLAELKKVAAVVFDPHSEYFDGKDAGGLKDLPPKLREKVVYLSTYGRKGYGTYPLRVHASLLDPSDFRGIVPLTPAQEQLLHLAYSILRERPEEDKETLVKVKGSWLKLLLDPGMERFILNKISGQSASGGDITALRSLRRKISYATGLVYDVHERRFTSEGVFTLDDEDVEAKNFLEKIWKWVAEESKVVIIDTSSIPSVQERILASMVARFLLDRYRRMKIEQMDKWEELPTLLILFEEAPRFLGRKVLEKGTNVFETIAREGRKFKVGLCAITQMPSLIPKEILSQFNTKVILGTPSPEDRKVLVESSVQDIADDSYEIQVLDRGEAIITSPFIKIPYPVKIILFKEYLKILQEKYNESSPDAYSVLLGGE